MVKNLFSIEVKKLDSPIALTFSTRVNFLDLLFLDKFTTVLLVLRLSSLTTSLLSALNAFEAKSNNSVIFNKAISDVAILLKPLIKRR